MGVKWDNFAQAGITGSYLDVSFLNVSMSETNPFRFELTYLRLMPQPL
jgi:hypothetical protein